MEDNKKAVKIFPRNLTARASKVVRGNPDGSRPESGVDNSYPGLEFDQRNLDKMFFPTFYFEFHREDGAILTNPDNFGLPKDDSKYYLWSVIGKSHIDLELSNKEVKQSLFNFQGLGGLEVWRRIHDLLPGRVSLLLGNSPIGFSNSSLSDGQEKLEECYENFQPFYLNQEDGKINWFVVTGERSTYLDKNGVILIESFPSGELTRTLCAPWQYDFRDCGCFYWAANKPDMVGHEKDKEIYYLNYMRKNRQDYEKNPDVIRRYYPNEENPDTWTSREYNYAEFIKNWKELPIVLNDRESGGKLDVKNPSSAKLMTKKEIIDELTYLTGVEHALTVKYLYAHYSIDAPWKISTNASKEEKNIHTAAYEVFKIAVDEMRHLRWVNECLILLNEPSSVQRAKEIGRKLKIKFALNPLTKKELDQYIKIEEPSQIIEGSIDGMYVHILNSIEKQPDLFGEQSDRLIHLIKLIIDEGEDHFQRFTAIKSHLEGIPESKYLRKLGKPRTNRQKRLVELCDLNYEVLLKSLIVAFNLGDKGTGQLLTQSIRAMHNLHRTAHLLAKSNVAVPFNLPDSTPPSPPITFNKDVALETISILESKMITQIDEIKKIGDVSEIELANKQEIENSQLFLNMRTVINEST